ncbi:MAG: twitching motility protein PilU, partial [Pseudomonadota bacterium]|nr:twitching motility protein PilU [Pseudomonadota bacterium]
MDRDKAIRYMHDLLRMLVQKNGSDLFVTVGAAPSMKIDGRMTPLSNQALSPQHTQTLVRSIMNDKQLGEFEARQEVNFAISLPGVSRFRVNAFTQRGSMGMVLRVIRSEIPNFDDLGLPPILREVAMTKRGLVIFVG